MSDVAAKVQQGPYARGQKDRQPSQRVHQDLDGVPDCPNQSRL